MNKTRLETSADHSPALPPDPFEITRRLDDSELTDMRTSRRLQKIVRSMESFLDSQLVRLGTAMEQCEKAVENDKILQRILAEFEIEKQQWELNRQAEIDRLQSAGEELIQGWEKLERERRNWLDQQAHLASEL